VTVVAADAIGNGPTTPIKSDPTMASNREVLFLLNESAFSILGELDFVRLDFNDFLRERIKLIFEAPTFDFRARIKEITRE
jgi:hypothetical protein